MACSRQCLSDDANSSRRKQKTDAPTARHLQNNKNSSGIVLLVTLVLLIVLATLGYTLSVRIAEQQHRNQYMIDYQSARYGCESGLKYALATVQQLNPQLIARPNEPDFSDLFALSEEEHQQLLADWAAKNASEQSQNLDNISNTVRRIIDFNDVNDVNLINRDKTATAGLYETEPVNIRGPYGPPWPYVTEPVEFEIGPCAIKIEIEDENAKYPIGWAMLEEEELKREATAGFETFCEWMELNSKEIDSLKKQLKEISEIKPFKKNFEPIKKKVPIKSSKSRRQTRSRRRTRYKTSTVPASVHTADFAKLFHSSLIDTQLLARPTILSDTRKESALKYMGMWASTKVNINTAPRHVLEAAFNFGGDAEKTAEEIIQRRKTKPFKDIEELRTELFRYSVSIDKCRDYITTVSRFFTIKVTAISGVAKTSAVIAVTKDKDKVQRIAIISD